MASVFLSFASFKPAEYTSYCQQIHLHFSLLHLFILTYEQVPSFGCCDDPEVDTAKKTYSSPSRDVGIHVPVADRI